MQMIVFSIVCEIGICFYSAMMGYAATEAPVMYTTVAIVQFWSSCVIGRPDLSLYLLNWISINLWAGDT